MSGVENIVTVKAIETQTAPPTKCSFFQMGTVRLRVSMP